MKHKLTQELTYYMKLQLAVILYPIRELLYDQGEDEMGRVLEDRVSKAECQIKEIVNRYYPHSY